MEYDLLRCVPVTAQEFMLWNDGRIAIYRKIDFKIG
jgi:hypothetical protein